MPETWDELTDEGGHQLGKFGTRGPRKLVLFIGAVAAFDVDVAS